MDNRLGRAAKLLILSIGLTSVGHIATVAPNIVPQPVPVYIITLDQYGIRGRRLRATASPTAYHPLLTNNLGFLPRGEDTWRRGSHGCEMPFNAV